MMVTLLPEEFLGIHRDTYTLPLTPQSISLEISQRTEEFQLRFGSIVLPRGITPETISWSGIFPSDAMRDDPMIVQTNDPWLQPIEWLEIIRQWARRRARLRLMVTETPIRGLDVFVQSFSPEWRGGFGEAYYDITLREWRQTEIKPYAAAGGKSKSKELTRVPLPRPVTYLTKTGDTLVLIAKKTLHDPTRWREVFLLNRTLIPNPTLIPRGLTLRVPRG